jgi:hypothetical protein
MTYKESMESMESMESKEMMNSQIRKDFTKKILSFK